MSLIFRTLFRGELVALLCIAAMCYSYPLFHRCLALSQNEAFHRLLDCLPYGVAIRRRDSSEWLCGNSSLREILNARESCNALWVLGELLRKAPGEPQDGGFSEVRVTLADENTPNERAHHGRRKKCDSSPRAGEGRVVELSGNAVDWEGQPAQLICVRDVTQLTKVDHLKLANSIKTRILRSLSHELRTPINCILNSLEYCKAKLEGDEESLANINVALANSNLLLYKYNDLLVF